MRSISLILGTYNHQPDGTASKDLEAVYQSTYKSFLSLLYKYPRIPVLLHYSGFLLEWLDAKHPEFMMLLKEMVKRKQVELLGGGYYAPVLAILPDADKLGQIEKMNTFLRTTFGTRPRGGWITEKVWEPALARILCNSGLEYTFLDDWHFRVAGIEEERCYRPFLTEDQGKMITVVPLQQDFEQMIPKTGPDDLIMELNRAAAHDQPRIAAVLLPGERLGGAEVFGASGWLPGLLRLIEENRSWLSPVIPRSSPEVLQPAGRLYFCCLSSSAIMTGSLSVQRYRIYQEAAKKLRRQEAVPCLHGGHFRQFLTRYPEISLLYSRLVYTHLLVRQIRGDKYKKLAAQNELWKGQGGDVYWNKLSSGAYTSCLRKAAYRSFIEAERITRGAGMFLPSIIATDFDMDGYPEYLYQGKVLNAFVHRIGACLLELDYLPRSWNYLDTIARWPEPYHRYKYEGCDWYLRKGFLDHFFAPNTDLERFDRMSYQENGDFLNRPFELAELKREQRELVLERHGRVRIRRKELPLSLRKQFRFRENGIDLIVCLKNDSDRLMELWYGSELNLALAGKGRESAVLVVQSAGLESLLSPDPESVEKANGVRVEDRKNQVQLSLAADREFSLWSLPVETVFYPNGIRESVYQSSCLVPHWQIELAAGQAQELKLSLDLKKG